MLKHAHLNKLFFGNRQAGMQIRHLIGKLCLGLERKALGSGLIGAL